MFQVETVPNTVVEVEMEEEPMEEDSGQVTADSSPQTGSNNPTTATPTPKFSFPALGLQSTQSLAGTRNTCCMWRPVGGHYF